MFGRVSTVALSDYANSRQYNGNELGMGIVPAKKWSGNINPDVPEYSHAHIEPGWIEWKDDDEDGYSKLYYPKYSSSGLKLPDFVNMYREEDGRVSYNSYRSLFGDGTTAIGPFTLHEVLKVYSVTKKLKPQLTNFGSYNASGGSTSVSLSSLTERDQTWLDHDKNSDPISLLLPQRKNYVLSEGSKTSSQRSRWLVESASLIKISIAYNFIGGPLSIYSSGGSNEAFIMVDIDNPEDYYINGLGFDLNVQASGFQSDYKEGTYETEPASSSTYERKIYWLKPKRYLERRDYDLSSLSQVGQTKGNWTYVKVPVKYKFSDSIEREHNYYGVLENLRDTDSWGPSPPSTSASVSFPTPVFVVNATEFWPYENADGSPVYDTSTGNLIAPPIP